MHGAIGACARRLLAVFASGLVSTLFACGGGGSGGGNPQDGNPNPTPGPVAGSYRETGRWLTGNRPNGIDVGADATVVVAMGGDRVSRYTSSGDLQGSVPIDNSFAHGLAVDGAGHAHVTEYSNNDSGRAIDVVSTAAVIKRYGIPPSLGNFSPWGIDLGADGTAYVADPVRGSVAVIRPDTSGYLIGSKGTGPGQFETPFDVAVAGQSLYIVDRDNRRVTQTTLAGELIRTWGQAGAGGGQLRDPTSIAVTSQGTVLVLDDRGKVALQAFTAEGGFLGSTDLPITEEGALAVGPDGSVYVTGLIDFPNGGWGVLRMAPASGTRP